MLLDFTDLLRHSGGTIHRDFRLDAGTLGDIELEKPVHGWINLQNARRNLVISGAADATVSLQCARCLKKFTRRFSLQLEEIAPLSLFHLPETNVPWPEFDEDDEREVDDDLLVLFDENQLKVDEMVRQAIWLQIPINPLCSPDCPGLEKFIDEKTTMDPRLEALKQWHQHDENKE